MNKIEKIRKRMLMLERKAGSGDISSAFELFKISEHGVTEKNANGEIELLVESNDERADYYLQMCNDIFIEKNSGTDKEFYLSDLIFTDFRKFKSLKIKLDKRLTVFIGDNGAGKTTIIDAIVKTISWIGPNIIRKGGRGKLVNEYDVNNESTRYAEIKSRLVVNRDSIYEPALRKNSKKSTENINSKIEPLEDLGELYRTLASSRNGGKGDNIELPIFIYYSVERNNSKPSRTFDEKKLNASFDRFESYDKKVLDGAADFSGFLQWLIIIDNLSGDGIKESLNEAEKLVSSLMLAGADSKEHNLNKIYIEELYKYNKLYETVKSKEMYYKKIEFVKDAIRRAMPGFENIYVDKTSGRAEIMLDIENEKINISQASQGQQVLISVVADISRRMITLNANLENPLETRGIIVIDEVELHLHPKWQQNIVNALMNTFQNIQFVISTHSPQVLSTIDKNNIRMFVNSEDGNILSVTPNFQTKGVKSADVMARIMGADSIPDVEEARDVDKFAILLSEDKLSEALILLEKLKKHFGENHPVILDCMNSIKIHELRNKIKKRY